MILKKQILKTTPDSIKNQRKKITLLNKITKSSVTHLRLLKKVKQDFMRDDISKRINFVLFTFSQIERDKWNSIKDNVRLNGRSNRFYIITII